MITLLLLCASPRPWREIPSSACRPLSLGIWFSLLLGIASRRLCVGIASDQQAKVGGSKRRPSCAPPASIAWLRWRPWRGAAPGLATARHDRVVAREPSASCRPVPCLTFPLLRGEANAAAAILTPSPSRKTRCSGVPTALGALLDDIASPTGGGCCDRHGRSGWRPAKWGATPIRWIGQPRGECRGFRGSEVRLRGRLGYKELASSEDDARDSRGIFEPIGEP